MKKLLLISLLILSANKLFAENALPVSKGSYLLGGSVYGNYYNFNQNETFYIGLSPNVGRFFTNNLAWVVNPYIQYQTYKFSSNSTSEYINYGLNIGLKYYSDNGFLAVIGGGLSLDKNGNIYYTLVPQIGYAYFINPKVSIEGLFGPRFYFYEGNNHIELPLNIGFQVFL